MNVDNKYGFKDTIYFIILKANYEHEEFKGARGDMVDGNGETVIDRVAKGDIDQIIIDWSGDIYYEIHDEDKGIGTTCDFYRRKEKEVFISRKLAEQFLNQCECRCFYGPKLKCDNECKYPGA